MCDWLASDPVAPVVKSVGELLSPHVTWTLHDPSFAPGSVNEPRSKLFAAPSSEDWLFGGETAGGTFATTILNVCVSLPPSLSVIFSVTV